MDQWINELRGRDGAADFDLEMELFTAGGISYLSKLPKAGDIPAGRLLVHNSVRPTRHLGSRGFRAWLQAPDHRLEVCDCSWAPEVGEHYRIAEGVRD